MAKKTMRAVEKRLGELSIFSSAEGAEGDAKGYEIFRDKAAVLKGASSAGARTGERAAAGASGARIDKRNDVGVGEKGKIVCDSANSTSKMRGFKLEKKHTLRLIGRKQALYLK